MEREAVILDDGSVVYIKTIANTSVYIPEETDIVFSNVGRVNKFRSTGLLGDNYMAIYDIKTNSFTGYYPELKFWLNETKGIIPKVYDKDLSLFRVLKPWELKLVARSFIDSHFQNIEENTKVVLVRKEYIISENKIRLFIKKFSFRKKYESNLNLEVYGNKIKYYGVILSYNDVTEDFPDYEINDSIYIDLETILDGYYQSISERGLLQPDGTVSFDNTWIDGFTIKDVVFLLDQLYSNNDFMLYINMNHLGNSNNNDDKKLKVIFDKHIAIAKDTNYNIVPQEVFKNNFTAEYFSTLRVRMLEFKHWVEVYTKYLDTTKWDITDFIVRVISLFNSVELSYLDYDYKIMLLDKMVKDNKDISGRWLPFYPDTKLTEEEVVIKIVESIKSVNSNGELNYSDINKFMDKLCSTSYFEGDTNTTLFEILYKRIDPDVIFGGAGARGQLMDAIYDLWLNSKYNPKANIPNYPSYSYEYTEYRADWNVRDLTGEPYFMDLDHSAAPRVLPYTSEKKWLWYDDNMNFKFSAPNKILALEKGNMHELFVGFYHIFQPVDLMNLKGGETFVSVPFDSSVLENYQNPCQIEAEGRGSNLPIFYLKYIDDIGDRKDAEETTMLIIDVVTTILGGWGIARRLIAEGAFIAIRKLTIKAADEGIVAALNAFNSTLYSATFRSNMLKILASVAIPSLEFALGIANIVHKIAMGSNCDVYNDCNNNPPTEGQPGYEQYKRCQAIQKWLFALEILTLSGDLISQRFFKKATRELQDSLPEQNPYPETIVTNSEYNGARNNINVIVSGSSNEVSDFISGLPPTIQNKINDLNLSDNQKMDFMFDFQGEPEIILHFTGNLDDIDNWRKLNALNVPDKKTLNVITDVNLTNTYEAYYSVTELKQVLNTLTEQNRIRFLKRFGNDVPIHQPRFIEAWNDLKDYVGIGDNPVILNQLVDFTDDLYSKFLHEFRHNKRGTSFRQRLIAEPTTVNSVVKVVLEAPNLAWYRKVEPEWQKWARTHFFKHYTQKGWDFERFINPKLIKRGSDATPEYNTIKTKILQDSQKNIDEYELFTSVQLFYGDKTKYFVADQLFVKFGTNADGERMITDIIVIETKLSSSTNPTQNQLEAIQASNQGFSVKSIEKQSESITNNIDKNELTNKDLELMSGQNVTFYKAFDGTNGDVLSGVDKLN